MAVILLSSAREENPNRTYDDLAPWNYAELLKALGCADRYTARMTTPGELDNAVKAARASKTGAYIEIIGGKMDMPSALAFDTPQYARTESRSGRRKEAEVGERVASQDDHLMSQRDKLELQ